MRAVSPLPAAVFYILCMCYFGDERDKQLFTGNSAGSDVHAFAFSSYYLNFRCKENPGALTTQSGVQRVKLVFALLHCLIFGYTRNLYLPLVFSLPCLTRCCLPIFIYVRSSLYYSKCIHILLFGNRFNEAPLK